MRTHARTHALSLILCLAIVSQIYCRYVVEQSQLNSLLSTLTGTQLSVVASQLADLSSSVSLETSQIAALVSSGVGSQISEAASAQQSIFNGLSTNLAQQSQTVAQQFSQVSTCCGIRCFAVRTVGLTTGLQGSCRHHFRVVFLFHSNL